MTCRTHDQCCLSRISYRPECKRVTFVHILTDQYDVSRQTILIAHIHRLIFHSLNVHRRSLKPGFHPNAIACVGKQPIKVATASTEHPIPIGSQ